MTRLVIASIHKGAGKTSVILGLANTDSSGVLAAAGINVLFSGNSASSIAVHEEILADPERLATALSSEVADNRNILSLSDLAEQEWTGLGDATAVDYHRQLITGVGQRVRAKQAQYSALEGVLQQLRNRWDTTSGVDINEEAAKLLIFEQMYQAVATYISTQKKALQSLMDVM